jgi:carboxyl-terminal processing protease
MRKRTTVILVACLVLFCSVISFFLGSILSVGQMVSWEVFWSKPLTEWFKPQYALFFDAEGLDVETVQAFNRVKNILSDRYYEALDINELFSSAIKGLAMGTDDPYTVYYIPEEMKKFQEDTSGNYVGIGVLVHMDENSLLTVSDVFPDSPAKGAGIQKGDKIVKVDNEDVTVFSDADLIVKRIKGEAGTSVKVTVYRPDQNDYLDFVMTRRAINVSYISSEVLDNQIGYVRIRQFDNDIAGDFAKHVNALLAQGVKGLVIDVRDNPGGDYHQVVQICDMLLPKGLIVYMEYKDKSREEEYSDAAELNIPMSILVNGYSASASEILTAALKEYGKATVVGTQTFGKGLVQEVIYINNGGGLKYTRARYFTPSGKSIHGDGVTPDVVIELDEKYKNTSIEDIPHGEDNQLQRAILEIEKKLP